MKVFLACSLDEEAISHLSRRHRVVRTPGGDESQLRELIGDCEVVVFRSNLKMTAELLSAAPNLKLLVRAGCGFDNVDLDYLQARNIQLTLIPQPAAQAVAELAFALMLCLARRIQEAHLSMRDGAWAKDRLMGHLLRGKTLGIVGAGKIGSRIGELGAVWEMKPIGCVERSSPTVAARLWRGGIILMDFYGVVRQSDFLVTTVPLKASTSNLIDGHVLSQMKAGSYLINLSRGGVVDEDALYRELMTGRIAGAALDVHRFEGENKTSPLADLPNVVLTPHIGSMTLETQYEIGRRVVEIVNAFSSSYALQPDLISA